MMVMLIMVVLVVKIMVLVKIMVVVVKIVEWFQTCGLGCGTGGRVLHSMFAKSQSPHSPEIQGEYFHKQMLNCTNKNTDSSPMMTLPSLATLVAHHCSSLALWSLVQRW